MNREIRPYTLAILVENSAGVLSQVSRLFSRKGYNIESIAAGTTQDPNITRITIISVGDELMITQVANQLRKLLPVLSVNVLDDQKSIQRELILVKVKAETREKREEVIQMVNVFRASVLDMSRESLTIAIVGNAEKSKALLNLLDDFGILEIARTGMIALERGSNTIYDQNKEEGEYNYGKNVL